MSEQRKVVILNDNIINIGEMPDMPEGATIEERQMVYSIENGWREVGWNPPISQTEELAQTLDMMLTELLPKLVGGEIL